MEDNKTVFCIIIVAYNPDKRIEDSIGVLSDDSLVGDIIVVDNSTRTNSSINVIRNNSKVTVITNGKNIGIAEAQNLGILQARIKGYDWALTLDHDTIVGGDLFHKYASYLASNNCSLTAIIGTDYYDIGSHQNKYNNLNPTEVSCIISSGSLINIDIFEKLGGMKGYYFIDQVDNEYCYRAKKNGYTIIVLPGVGMEHRLGKIEEKKLLGRSFFIYDQPPIRVFYRTRNIIYFLREYKDFKLFLEKSKDLMLDLIRIVFEDMRFEKYKNYFKGIRHGLFDKIPPKEVNYGRY